MNKDWTILDWTPLFIFFYVLVKLTRAIWVLYLLDWTPFLRLYYFERAVNKGFLGSVSDGLDSSCSSLLSDTDIEYNASSPDEKALGR